MQAAVLPGRDIRRQHASRDPAKRPGIASRRVDLWSRNSQLMYTPSTSGRRYRRGDASMNSRATLTAMVLGALMSGLCHPACAQSAVGGPKKPNALGAVKQTSPVVPVNKGGSVIVSAPRVAPVNKGNSVVVSS